MKHLNYHKDAGFSEVIYSINTVSFLKIVEFLLSSQREINKRGSCVRSNNFMKKNRGKNKKGGQRV